VVPGGATTTLATIAAGEALPDLSNFDVVLTEAQMLAQAPDLGSLRSWVERGGSLVVAQRGHVVRCGGLDPSLVALTGLSGIGDALPTGEWIATVASSSHPVIERADHEFPVWGAFVPLDTSAGASCLLGVRVGTRELCALAEHRLGTGRVISYGLHEAFADETSELERILSRALCHVTDQRTGEPPTGVAIVGYGPYGGMGYAHGLAVQATDGLELVAVCDSSPDRRKDAERDFPGVRSYGEMGEVLRDTDIALAVVATPPVSHFELGLRLLRLGRHVVMEKPLCFTVAEADALSAAAAKNGASLTVHQNRRWDTDFLAVRKAVGAGALGEVFNVETFVGGFDHPCRAWHSEVTVSGGAAYDWGSHYLDWILLLMGSAPARVSSTGHKRVWHDVSNLDQERIHLWWPDGREAEFVHSDVAAVRRPKFYVQGTTGTLVGTYRTVTFERIEAGRGFVTERAHHAEAPADLRMVTYAGNGALVETSVPLVPERRFPFHRNLADHVRDGTPLAVPVASVRPVIAILEAASRSTSQGGMPIDLARVDTADWPGRPPNTKKD